MADISTPQLGNQRGKVLDATPDKLAETPVATLDVFELMGEGDAATGRGSKRAFEEVGIPEPVPLPSPPSATQLVTVDREQQSDAAAAPMPIQDDANQHSGQRAPPPLPAPGAKPCSLTNVAHVTLADLEATIARRRCLAKASGGARRFAAAAAKP